MDKLAQAFGFLYDHRIKILGTVGFVATTVLQQKAIHPEFLTAGQTIWLTVVAQLASGGAIAVGVVNTIKDKGTKP